MSNKLATQKQLQAQKLALAANGLLGLTSFDGNDMQGFDDEDYDNFRPKRSQKNKKAQKRQTTVAETDREIQLTVTNNTANAEQFYLIPSFLVAEGEKGHPFSGQSISGAVLDFNGASSDNALKVFYRSIDRGDAVVGTNLRLTSNKPTFQYTTVISVSRQNSMFGGSSKVDEIKLNSKYVETVQGATIIERIPIEWSLDNKLQATMTVAANSTLNVVIKCGVIVSIGEGAQRSANDGTL